MLDSAIVEVDICLILTFLLLRLICSTLNERIAAALGLRAKSFEQGIVNRLAEAKAGDAFVGEFYNHPSTNSLRKATPNSCPLYISAELLTKTALHMVSTAAGAVADATTSWTNSQQGVQAKPMASGLDFGGSGEIAVWECEYDCPGSSVGSSKRRIVAASSQNPDTCPHRDATFWPRESGARAARREAVTRQVAGLINRRRSQPRRRFT